MSTRDGADQRPHDEALEAQLEAKLLIDPSLLRDLCTLVRPEDMYLERHQIILRSMCRLVDFDVEILRADLAERGELDAAGGAGYLAQLIGEAVFGAEARVYAERIREMAEVRRILDAAQGIAQVAYKMGSKPAVARMRQELEDLDLTQPVAEVKGSTWLDLDAVIGSLHWAWHPWLAGGYLTGLVAEQEAGKSYLALAIARRYLTGEPWPDGQAFTEKTGAVIWAEAEASQGLNRERAKSWGLPTDRILSPLADPLADFRLDNEAHKQALAGLLGRGGVRLAILDSLSGAHGRREQDAEMGPMIKWLAELARDTGKPVLLTHHLRKRTILDVGNGPSLDRVRGSGTITQTARIVWAIDIPDPGNKPDARRLSVIKCNLGPKPKAIGFAISDAGVTFREAPEPPKVETKTDQAKDLLLSLLDGGPVAAVELKAEAEGAGYSWAAMNRAKKELGINPQRIAGRWVWSLPYRGAEVLTQYDDHLEL